MAVYSMTGFGRGMAQAEDRKITIELKSVNHRYLDINLRLPRFLSFLDVPIRGILSDGLHRGHVDVYLNYENNRQDARKLKVDTQLAQSYAQAAQDISDQLEIRNDSNAWTIARMPDVISVENGEEDEKALRELMVNAMNLAVDELKNMRQIEGANLIKNISEQLGMVRSQLDIICGRSGCVVQEYREKLTARLDELLQGAEVDPGKIASEVAFFADRCCIDEEIVRLRSHLKGMEDIFSSNSGSIGRKLDFLVQEINREVNTICSKSSDMDITNAGLEIKSAIEKIREQVQNIE